MWLAAIVKRSLGSCQEAVYRQGPCRHATSSAVNFMRSNCALIVYLRSTLHSGIQEHLCNSLQIKSSFFYPVQRCSGPRQDTRKLGQDVQGETPWNSGRSQRSARESVCTDTGSAIWEIHIVLEWSLQANHTWASPFRGYIWIPQHRSVGYTRLSQVSLDTCAVPDELSPIFPRIIPGTGTSLTCRHLFSI